MIKRLVVRKADALVDMGRPILARLEADSRLAEAAASMKTTQTALEARVDALNAAWTAEQLARIQRDEERRQLNAEAREFAFIILSGNGNHHNADPYLRYFPEGYGRIMLLPSSSLEEYVRLILTTLDEETDTKILSHRDRVQGAFDRFLVAEDAYRAARSARSEAFALAQAEKREWTRGVVRARALAEWACHFEQAYLRSIFSALRRVRRKATEEEPEIVETPAITAVGPQPLSVPAQPPDETTGQAAA